MKRANRTRWSLRLMLLLILTLLFILECIIGGGGLFKKERRKHQMKIELFVHTGALSASIARRE
jgi:hypothetical protein